MLAHARLICLIQAFVSHRFGSYNYSLVLGSVGVTSTYLSPLMHSKTCTLLKIESDDHTQNWCELVAFCSVMFTPSMQYGIPCKHWASGVPVNFTGVYGIPCKHQASGACPSELHRGIWHPLQTSGIWCPSELHRGIWHPLQTSGIWCPSELHRGIWHPLQTSGIWCPSELHRGKWHPLQTLGIWCTNELHRGIWHPLQTSGIWCPNELHRGKWHPLQPCELHRGIWHPLQTLGTKYPMVLLKCTNGILSLRRFSHYTQHIYHQASLCPQLATYLDSYSLYRNPN